MRTSALCLLLCALSVPPALAQRPPAPAETLPDRVAGNLITINNNAGWCWYQDEKAVFDPVTATFHLNTTANQRGFAGKERCGNIEHTTLQLATGNRARTVLGSRPYRPGRGDDHAIGAIWIRPDGRILDVWSGHNNDHFTNFRITASPHDATSWRPEQRYNWEKISGRKSSRRFTYSNVYFLAAERDGKGRLYNIGRGDQNSPNIAYSDDLGETWHYAGKLTTFNGTTPSSYSNGYFKFQSNGRDRIDFICTDHHPRNYNNGVYHGYIQNGKSHDSFGKVIDDDIYDEEAPDPRDFTPIFLPSPEDKVNDENEYHRGWTIELELTPEGRPVALFTTRFGTKKASNRLGDADHRLFYARFDGKRWKTTELCKMGGPLLPREQDYTGLGAIHPEDPDLIYVSTPIDPRSGAELAKHEIFRGTTQDKGATWRWQQITFDSTVDNLRPAIPKWRRDCTAMFWMRGTYWHQTNYNQSLVGLIQPAGETVSKVTYIDAGADNTKFAGAPWKTREDLGNGGRVLECNPQTGDEPPSLTTTVTGLEAGTYDVFAFFWSPTSEDWRVRAGFAQDHTLVFRRRTCQRAVPGQFANTVDTGKSELGLYRAYVGRRTVQAGKSIAVVVQGVVGKERTAFDGVGVARVVSGR